VTGRRWEMGATSESSERARPVRVAMIGAGEMANQVHYPSLASFEDVEIAAICDLDKGRLDATADRYGVEKRYTDCRKMIEEVAPDAVYAIGQPHLMYDVWIWCLSQGLNLFIEKPMGITMHQARRLAELSEKKQCITQVGFQRRKSPMLVLLRDKCRERGPIFHAVCSFYKCEIRPYLEARDRLTDDGIHAVDTLRWMCGGDVVEIQSATNSVGVPDVNHVAAVLRFDSGSTGVLMTTWASGRRTFRVEMHSPGICAEAEHEGKGRLYADGDTKGVEYDSREVAGSDEFFVHAGFQAKNREFIECVKQGGGQPSSHFGDAVKTMAVAQKILACALLEST
jgi:predicted dehydrogenase